MSKENLEKFMSKVADSEELQAKIGEEIDAEALIALGAECGCEFTAEELQESAELSDEELDTVSGGRKATVFPEGSIYEHCRIRLRFDDRQAFVRLCVDRPQRDKWSATEKRPPYIIID